MENSKLRCEIYTGCGCICFLFILICVFVFGGIRFVAFDEYAIAYRTIVQTPDDIILTEGTHWLSIDTELYTYSRVVKPVQLNGFKCLSQDGIIIDLNVKFQFQIKQEELLDIFFEFGEQNELERHMTDIAKDSLRDTCGKFRATNFPNKRSEIQTKMEEKLIDDFRISNSHTILNFLQLENFSFPDILDDAIDDKQQALQDKDKALQEREGQLTIAETKRLTAEVEAEKTLIQAQAEVNSIILEANTTANAVYAVWNNRAITFKEIMDNIGMTVVDFVNEYLKAEILGSSENIITGL